MMDMLKYIVPMLHEFMKSPVFLIVLDNKGGVGKSLIAQIFAALLRHDDKFIVRMIDTDNSNSTTMQIDPDARMINLQEQNSRGVMTNLFGLLADKAIHHLVMDVGAREEPSVAKRLAGYCEKMRAVGGRVIVVRPITLGSHNQRNAINFLDTAEQLSIPVVFVRNLGGGRHEDYYERWEESQSRKQALERGAVETMLQDAHVLYADEAVGYGLSLAECAVRDFSKLRGDDLKEAEAFYDIDVAAFLNEWLRESMRDFGAATAEAIAKRDALDSAKPVEPMAHGPHVAPKASPKPKTRKA